MLEPPVVLRTQSSTDIAYYDGGAIYLNYRLLSSYPEVVFWFCYYHELGHYELKHSKTKGFSAQWRRQEREATEYALQELEFKGLWSEQARQDLLRFCDDFPEMRYYKLYIERYETCKKSIWEIA